MHVQGNGEMLRAEPGYVKAMTNALKGSSILLDNKKIAIILLLLLNYNIN